MDVERIRASLLAMPEIAELPPLVELLARVKPSKQIPCWDYPGLACEALGGEAEQTLPAAIAIFASLGAIHLIDDMLDEEPAGLHADAGPGIAANVASCLQAAAHRAIAQAELEPALAGVMQGRLATMTMATALAQHRDTSPCADEQAYFRVIEGKTPPLFSCALALGALHAGGRPEQVEGIAGLGLDFGRMIQMSDDLKDALDLPLAADWRRPTNNLALIYASTAEHPDRARFLELLARLQAPSPSEESIAEAHRIVWRCGAAAYCIYHMIESHQRAIELLRAIDLPNPAPLLGLLRSPMQPVVGILRRAGIAEPEQVIVRSVPTWASVAAELGG